MTKRPRLSGLQLTLVLLGVVVLALAAPVAATAVAPGTVPRGGTGEDPVGQWPLRPRPTVVRGFDPPSSRWGSGHRGVDLAGRIGEAVRAALPGTVGFTGRIAGVPVVVVDHGTTRTTYQPVAASVPRGTPVAGGTVIGHLTWFGTHCSPAACLHWGWIRGSEYLDPLRLVGPLPVRLLPLDGTTPPYAPVASSSGAPVTGAPAAPTPRSSMLLWSSMLLLSSPLP